MKKFLFLNFALLSGLYLAQKKDLQAKLDSIGMQRWQQKNVNLDSVSNISFEPIKKKINDTIFTPEVKVAKTPQEIPLTPYNLIKKGPVKWFFYGQNNLLFNQASFENWISGGENNIGFNAKVNYNIIYRNGKHYLENIILMGYGLVSTEGQSVRKTDDFLNLMSNYGYEIGKDYYLSAGMQFRSQFSPGYDYKANPSPMYANRISKFMAPAYLNLGIGVSYNPKENFQVIFRPINGKFTFVLDSSLQKKGNFGLERDGQSIRGELGAWMNVLYRLKIFKNINFDNQLSLFSNYIDHPERVDIAYNGSLNIRFNDYISTIVSIDLIYDHDQIARLQRKQTLGVGLSYNLGNNLDKIKSSRILKPVGVK